MSGASPTARHVDAGPPPSRHASAAARSTAGRRRRVPFAVAALLVALGAVAWGRAGWLAAKATLAQHLLERAWEAGGERGAPEKPWPWADIVPVARLHLPSLDRTLVVLQDASGEALAFGPGLVAGRPERAARETIALGGHRDSHLAFLETLPPGAPLELERPDGARQRYRLAGKRVVDGSRESVAIAADAPGLVLITCYPFRATQTGGPLRLVATAVPVAPSTTRGAQRAARSPSSRASNG